MKKRKLLRPLAFLLGFLLLFSVFFTLFMRVLPDPYTTAYQRAIVRQYDHFRAIEGNKMVFIGNSSLSFGFDLNLMEDLSEKPCAILGNHAGMGLTYFLEMSKENLQRGDVVVVEYSDSALKNMGTQLLFSGIGQRADMYRYFPLKHWKNVFLEYPTYTKKTMNYMLAGGMESSGSYSIASYDERGNMSLYREACNIPSPYTEEVAKTYQWATFDTAYSTESVENLNAYTAWCHARGIQVYVIGGVYLDEAVRSTEEEIEKSDQALAALLDAPLITNTSDYIFTRDYIYNAIMHCNTLGAQRRTTQIHEDLMSYSEK